MPGHACAQPQLIPSPSQPPPPPPLPSPSAKCTKAHTHSPPPCPHRRIACGGRAPRAASRWPSVPPASARGPAHTSSVFVWQAGDGCGVAGAAGRARRRPYAASEASRILGSRGPATRHACIAGAGTSMPAGPPAALPPARHQANSTQPIPYPPPTHTHHHHHTHTHNCSAGSTTQTTQPHPTPPSQPPPAAPTLLPPPAAPAPARCRRSRASHPPRSCPPAPTRAPPAAAGSSPAPAGACRTSGQRPWPRSACPRALRGGGAAGQEGSRGVRSRREAAPRPAGLPRQQRLSRARALAACSPLLRALPRAASIPLPLPRRPPPPAPTPHTRLSSTPSRT